MLRGKAGLFGHVTKHPLLFSFHQFELQPCLKAMSTVVRFEKFVWWSNLGIYHFEVVCLHLDVSGWRRNDFCSRWIVLCWNQEEIELWQHGRAKEEGKSRGLRPKSSEWAIHWRAFGELNGALFDCRTVRRLKVYLVLFC